MSSESFEAPSLEDLAALLPAYDFEAFIAQGGMGAVYKARQRSLERDVAIKILPRELGEDPEFHLSFETEAKAMARLNHPNLIGVYDFGDVDGMPYIVMEYVNGKSLFHSAYNLAVDPLQAVGIVKGICDGLAHAHENGVIHRDIKPANILLNERVVPKIGDFGLARPVGAGGSGLVMGTPGYVAPEVLQHPEHADRRSDLFALGVVLYELLIGRCPPYQGALPPASTVCGCDVSLDRICDKAMHPLAELRYQSAEEMSADLDAWMRKANTPANFHGHGVLGHAKRPVAPPPPAGRRGASYEVMERRESSSGMVKGLLMLAAAIVVVAIGWSKYNQSEKAKAAALLAGSGGDVPALNNTPGAGDSEVKKPEVKPVDVTPGNTKPAGERLMESLTRLRDNLRAGKRAEMPEGSQRLGETYFLVIPTPMSWRGAQVFAENYGAHLFIAENDEQLGKVTLLMPAGEGGAEAGLWVGAGSVPGGAWAWIDGTSWQLDAKPQGTGSSLILTEASSFKAREASDRYPFVIQWQVDGTNPAALALVLERTGKSIKEGKPVFPPGTLEFDGGYAYFAIGTSTFHKSMEFAGNAGGRLFEPSTETKANWLDDHLPTDGIADGLWAGAFREGDKWAWVSGDPWEYTRWKDEAQPGNHGGLLKVISGGDWVSAYAGDPASGFVIEWATRGGGSGGIASGRGSGGDSLGIEEAAPPAVAELEAKAKELLVNLGKERDKDLAANAKTFGWDLDSWHKDLSKNDQAAWNRDVSMLKALVSANRVPGAVEPSTGIRLSPQMAKICDFCFRKQKDIDAAYESKADKIRASYATRMAELAKKLAGEGDAKGSKAAEGRASKASDLKTWLGSLGEVGTGASASASAGASTSFDPIVGAWNWRGGEIISLSPDGSLSFQRSEDVGKWKLDFKDDGGSHYTLSWRQKGAKEDWIVKVNVAPDGKRFEGKNPSNEKVRGRKIPPSCLTGTEDPLVGVWAWGKKGGTYYYFSEDGTAATLDDSGKWRLESEEGGKRNYAIQWTSENVTDRISVSRGGDTFKGTNSRGQEISGERELPE